MDFGSLEGVLRLIAVVIFLFGAAVATWIWWLL